MDLIAVYTTVADDDQAAAIACAAVERRLAACVQQERITSTYRWNGQVQRESEIRLMLKTTRACYAALESLVLELHPYELPALHAVEVLDASAGYAAWVRDSVEAPPASGGA